MILQDYLKSVEFIKVAEAFKALDKYGYAPGFNNIQEWNKAIQKMIDAFELMKYSSSVHSKEEEETIKIGLNLFCQYFRNIGD